MAAVKNNMNNSDFQIFEFESWYHEYWGEFHKPNQSNFSSFDIINAEISRN